MSAFSWADDQKGRRLYREYMRKRVLKIACSDKPWAVDKCWDAIRRGWYLGAEQFRVELLSKLNGIICSGRRDSYAGEECRCHDETEASRMIRQGMELLGINAEELEHMRKSAPEKQVLAWLIRKRTCVSNRWIAWKYRTDPYSPSVVFFAKEYFVPLRQRITQAGIIDCIGSTSH